ncbi:TMEM165/GDT1 family protein [Polynucleobacter necessarius]|nr:TMEM165/GDT1 family protein [Polynucleobacter necessarius]
MGDKAQLLSLMLAARYPKQALAIIAGIFIAMIAIMAVLHLSVIG